MDYRFWSASRSSGVQNNVNIRLGTAPLAKYYQKSINSINSRLGTALTELRIELSRGLRTTSFDFILDTVCRDTSKEIAEIVQHAALQSCVA
jgi:hypothetical protein